MLQSGDGLLLGADLKKEREILEPAYDDLRSDSLLSFNLNLLASRQLASSAGTLTCEPLNITLFTTTEIGRVGIYIESATTTNRHHQRHLDLATSFEEGERIHTENSYKYDLSGIAQLATETGFTCARTWLDAHERFSSNLLLAT